MRGVNTFSLARGHEGFLSYRLSGPRKGAGGEGLHRATGCRSAGRADGFLACFPAVSDPSCWGGRAVLVLVQAEFFLCSSVVLSVTQECDEAVCRLDRAELWVRLSWWMGAADLSRQTHGRNGRSESGKGHAHSECSHDCAAF